MVTDPYRFASEVFLLGGGRQGQESLGDLERPPIDHRRRLGVGLRGGLRIGVIGREIAHHGREQQGAQCDKGELVPELHRGALARGHVIRGRLHGGRKLAIEGTGNQYRYIEE